MPEKNLRAGWSVAVLPFVLLLLWLPAMSVRAQVTSLRVMTFNIWVGGTNVSFPKVAEAIDAADADIVGLQESNGNAQQLASNLSLLQGVPWYVGSPQIISRYPILNAVNGEGSIIELSPGQKIAVFNRHLTASPYGPYDLRDGRSVTYVLDNESTHHMVEMQSTFTAVSNYKAAGWPVFLTGDFNVPSALDWTDANKASHFNVVVGWPVSNELATRGFIDSYRTVWSNEVTHPGITWTPGYPAPHVDANEVFDRIDFVYFGGPGVSVVDSEILGHTLSDGVTDIAVVPWPSDHRAVVSTFTLVPQFPPPLPSTDLQLNKSQYAPGEAIVATFGNAPGGARDWIGIYPPGVVPDGSPASTMWNYLNGSHTPPNAGFAAGSVTFANGTPGFPLAQGSWVAYFFENDGYTILDSVSFSVAQPGGGPGKKRIFRTSTAYAGNLGGVSGADAKCAADPARPAGGSYKALLADGAARTSTANWVLAPSTTYGRVDGTTIGTTNAGATFGFPLAAPMTGANERYWSGLTSTYGASANDCGNWTSNAKAVKGSAGKLNATSAKAIAESNQACNAKQRLLCVEQ